MALLIGGKGATTLGAQKWMGSRVRSPKKIKQLIKEYFQVKFKDNEIMQVKLDGGEL